VRLTSKTSARRPRPAARAPHAAICASPAGYRLLRLARQFQDQPVTLAHQLARLRAQRQHHPEPTDVLGGDSGLRGPLPPHTLLPGGIARDTVAENDTTSTQVRTLGSAERASAAYYIFRLRRLADCVRICVTQQQYHCPQSTYPPPRCHPNGTKLQATLVLHSTRACNVAERPGCATCHSMGARLSHWGISCSGHTGRRITRACLITCRSSYVAENPGSATCHKCCWVLHNLDTGPKSCYS
jgi:hypothetical protein